MYMNEVFCICFLLKVDSLAGLRLWSIKFFLKTQMQTEKAFPQPVNSRNYAIETSSPLDDVR